MKIKVSGDFAEIFGTEISPEKNTIYADIRTYSISAAFEDHHGIKWDKEGNVIATFTIDDACEIVSMEVVSEAN